MTPAVQGSEFAQLRAFVSVAEHASFSRAAEQFGITPSSLSQTIRSLEERLSLRLFNRTTRSVALTPAGDALLQRLRPAMDEIAAALANAAHFRDSAAGTVRVHAVRGAATAHIEPILGEFHRTYPDILLDVTVDDATVDIIAGGWDIALRPGEVVEKDMIAVQLGGEMRQYPVATPQYLDGRDIPEKPEDLLSHNCIRWRWAGRPLPYNWEFNRDGEWFELAVRGSLIATERPMMMRACLDHVGIAFATNREADGLVSRGDLVAMLDRYCASYPGYFLCYPKQRQMAPALRAFIDFIRAKAKE